MDKNNLPFPVKIIQYLMNQKFEELKYLHAKRNLHRHIKLDYILVHFENKEKQKKENVKK